MATVGAAGAAAVGATVIIIHRERVAYRQIQEHLDEIVRKGKDEHIWIVNTNACGLPEYRGFFFRLFERHYKSTDESPSDYLRRIFGSFYLYEQNGLLVARKRDLSLHFDFIPQGTELTEEERVLFRPRYSSNADLKPLTATLPIRNHQKRVDYKSFSTHESLKNLNRIDLPDKIVYK